MPNLELIDAAYHLPSTKFTSEEIERKIEENWMKIKHWVINRLTWVKERYYRTEQDFPSTLAAEACKKLITRNQESVDLIIFASTSRDVTEPATANIVQSELWIKCPVFDVSNACNSFLSGINIANSFLLSWRYSNILLCTWETPSITINWETNIKKDLITWTTLWDAWAAFLLWKTNNSEKWVKYDYFMNEWDFWEDICVKWWWTRSPRELEDTYFKSHLNSSIWYFKENGLAPLIKWLEVSWWNPEDIDKIFFHQASTEILKELIKTINIPKEKIFSTFENYWNTASASIPLGVALEKEKWNIKEWEKIVFICPAAWLAYWIVFLQI